MRKFYSLILLSLILIFNSCFSKKEDPLEKERKEFNKAMEDKTALTLYKGIKVSIRSLPLNSDLKNIDSLVDAMDKDPSKTENIQKYTLILVSKLLGVAGGSTDISLKEGIGMVKTFGKLKDELKDADEDKYPTILEVLLYIDNLSDSLNHSLVEELKWNSSKEHLILGTVLTAAKQLPESFQLYEISKLDIEKLEKNEIKPVSAIIKGLVFAQNKWYYLSEEALNQGINSLEKDKIVFEFENSPVLFQGTKVDTYDAQIAQLHALSCLLRGYARSKMDDKKKNDLTVEDFELFLKDAETLGMNNELNWFAGAYVYIKKEDADKAIPYLDSLQKSDYFSENERDAIQEIKDYVSKRNADKALNVFYDKLFIGKLVTKYFYNYFIQYDWYAQVNKSETGNKLLNLPEVIDSEIKKTDINISTDDIKEKGKELIEDIF